MNVDINWVAILGFAFGLAAFLRWVYQDIVNYTRMPRLTISHGPFVINWQSIKRNETRRFAHFEAVSRGGVAHHCLARARILKHPAEVTLLQKEFPLHWADTPYSTVATGMEPVDIGAEARRLDIAFTVSSRSGACYLALPLVLAEPGKIPQATLPPGEYTLEIAVTCINGKGDTKVIRLVSPQEWEGLRAQAITRVD